MKEFGHYIGYRITTFVTITCISFIYCLPAWAQEINWDKLVNAVIACESNGNPVAYNKKSGAIGLMQITPIVLNEYNKIGGGKIPKNSGNYYLYMPAVNRAIGTWYLRERIPWLLKNYGIPLYTAEDCQNRIERIWQLDLFLISYNWGIGNCVKWYNKGADYNKLPNETKQYLRKVKNIYYSKGGQKNR